MYLRIGINQNTPRTINQVDAQNMKREYQRGNSCALFNITSETYCSSELQVMCNPDLNLLDEKSKQITKSTYNYFRKGNVKVEDAIYFIKELFKHYYILTYKEIKNYSSYLDNINIPYDENVFQIGLNTVLQDRKLFQNISGTLVIKHKYILENEDDNIYTFEPENNQDTPQVYRYYGEINYPKHMTRNYLKKQMMMMMMMIEK